MSTTTKTPRATRRADPPAADVTPLAEVQRALHCVVALAKTVAARRKMGYLTEMLALELTGALDQAAAGLQRAADGLALPQLTPAGAPAESPVRCAELAELADSADGLAAGLVLIGESCTSDDARKIARAASLAFTLGSVAINLADSLSEGAARLSRAAPARVPA